MSSIFQVETDISEHAIEGVLFQEQEVKWKPIVFLFRTMQPAERNYEIYNKELLTIVEALIKWKQYLLGTFKKFEVWTNQKNVKYFRELYKLNGWQTRWYLKLQYYNFILQHILEKINTKADVLLRKDWIDTKEDNKNMQMLKEELWTRW